MRYLDAVITVFREWIIRLISQAEPPLAGRVVVTAEDSPPLPPTSPPHLCAYEAQQVETLGEQLESILAQYQAAVEEFTECMESTIATVNRSDFNVGRNHLRSALQYMRQNLSATRAIIKKMRSK